MPAHPALSPTDPNSQLEHAPAQSTIYKVNGVTRPDKRQIEQRIEEDRERHKRLRESIWAVGEGDEEFEKMWDEASDINEDDYLAAEEDAAERRQAIEIE